MQKNIQDIYPLSPMQEGILFHSLYGSNPEVYSCQMSCLFQGLKVDCFRSAWDTAVGRHSVLRTAFLWEGISKPTQVVLEGAELKWEEQDWRGLGVEEQQELLRQFLKADREKGFNLKEAPLLRMALLRTGNDDYYFVWSNPHILLDGWSRQTLIQEVTQLYDRYVSGENVQLPPAPPYRNYIEWLAAQDMTVAESYWREELKGFGYPTRVGRFSKTPAPAHSQGQFNMQERTMTAAVSQRLAQLARETRVTISTLLQGAWGLVLGRHAESQDVVFGITATGRPPQVAGIDSMIGLFINTLPLRVRPLPHVSLGSYLKGLQARQVMARDFEYTPLVQMQSWSEVPGGTPLFESILVFENYPISKATLEHSAAKMSISEVGSFDLSHYPVTLYAAFSGELGLKLTYDLGRVSNGEAELLLDHLEATLESFIAGPDQKLAEILMLSEKERARLLHLAETGARPLLSSCVHELIEQQARKTPDAIAIEFKEQQLTYRALNQRANRLAHLLRQMGARQETHVGVCVERSLEMVISMLAVLKAGAAYLPLDPAYPEDRLTYMLQDSATRILITDRETSGLFRGYEGKTVVLGSEPEPLSAPADHDLEPLAGPENIAYLMYTSGSTGKPKGVHVVHSAVVNFLISVGEKIGISAADRLLAVTTFTFDIAALEIYLPLAAGARIILLSREEAADGMRLAEELSKPAVTIMQATPSRWLLALEAGWNGNPQLKALCGGEAFPPELANRLLGKTRALWNMYGPTETTIWSSMYDVGPSGDNVPIGKPLDNTQMYVLDESGRPAPIGVTGDLLIGGAGLARGYWRRPELSAEKFVPDPFHASGGGRLYLTGDRARWLEDGNLEFAGRMDDQVKLRGYRIELREIQARIDEYPQMQRCVVVLREDLNRDKQLVAYFVPQQNAKIDPGYLQKYLLSKLPQYMVPGVYMELEDLPQTPNGKIDRKKLPAPDEGAVLDTQKYLKPRDTIEGNLRQIWEDVLNVRGIGVRDNFFQLGGHSLKALTLSTRLAHHYGTGISFGVVFEYPTIEQMAAFLRKQVSWVYPSCLIPIQPDGELRPLFCVHPLYGMAHCYVELSRLLGDDQPVYGFQAQGLDQKQPPLLTIEEMAASYVKAMRSLQPRGPYQVAGVSMGSAVAFEIARQVRLMDERVSLLALLDGNYEETPVNLVNASDERELEAELLQWQQKFIIREANKVLEVSDDDPGAQDLHTQAMRFLEKLKEMDRVPQDITLDQFRRILDIMAINGRALSGYVPQPYDGDALLITSTLDPKADPTMGWSSMIQGKLDVRVIPGKHGECILHPGVVTLAQILKEVMEENNRAISWTEVPLVEQGLQTDLV